MLQIVQVSKFYISLWNHRLLLSTLIWKGLMRKYHPSFNFDTLSTHQSLILLLMSKVVKSHVKVDKQIKMQSKVKGDIPSYQWDQH